MPLELPVVPLEESVVVPAQQERTYNATWIKDFQLRAHDPTLQSGSLYIATWPLESGTGNVLASGEQELRTDEFWLMVSEVPSAQLAMGAVLQALPDIRTWIRNRQESQNGG